MFYQIRDDNNEILVSNLPTTCHVCYKACNSICMTKIDCKLDKNKRRLGKIINTKGITFLCCNKAKTAKLFKSKIENLSYSTPDFKKVKSDLVREIALTEQKRVIRLVHNLISINAHNIQEIYDLVPQELLAADLQNQIDTIKSEVSKNLDNAALTFLRIAKHNVQMKSEFSIYRKMFQEQPKLEYRMHPIKKVILNILHTFFVDFKENSIRVDITDYKGLVKLDYESIAVALYHLIENASKYILPKTEMKINILESNDSVLVDFEMESVYIEDYEIDKIFNEGYSGVNVKKLGKHGEGIGMNRIKNMLDLNKANFEVIRGETPFKHHGLKFAENKFRIVFNKN